MKREIMQKLIGVSQICIMFDLRGTESQKI